MSHEELLAMAQRTKNLGGSVANWATYELADAVITLTGENRNLFKAIEDIVADIKKEYGEDFYLVAENAAIKTALAEIDKKKTK